MKNRMWNMRTSKLQKSNAASALKNAKLQSHQASQSAPLLLDIHELARALRVGRTTIENWTRSRRIPSIKIKRVLRYDLKKVMTALEAYERKAVGV